MKKLILGAICVLLITIGMIGILDSSYSLAQVGWDDCLRGETDCAYPGECRLYVDTNDDGICDHSQPYPQDTTDKDLDIVTEDNPDMYVQDEKLFDDSGVIAGSSRTSIESSINSISGVDDSVLAGDNITYSRFSYYFFPIILIISFFYGFSYLLSIKRIIKVAFHRKIWNVILLVSTIISVFLGIVLILRVDFGIDISFPFNSLFWHVEAGIAMALIAVFHIGWHWRYFQKMLKHAEPPSIVASPTEIK